MELSFIVFSILLFAVILICYKAKLSAVITGFIAIGYTILFKIFAPIPNFIIAFIIIVEVICILKEL